MGCIRNCCRASARINQAWAADLTYIRIANSFVYLAVILDLSSRRVIGWAISKHIDAELACEAIRQAIQTRQPMPGCVHHSDRGGIAPLLRRAPERAQVRDLELSQGQPVTQ